MESEQIAKSEAQKEWERRMINFTTAMVDLVYWDREPLERALAYNVTMQKENSSLRGRIAELESQLTKRALDGALSSCWTIESAKDEDSARKIKLYIRENWQELAELLDKYCLQEAQLDNAPRQ